MILKPSGCEGCPFASKGRYFTPDTIVPGSKVLFIAQNPGPNEEAGRKMDAYHYQDYTQVQPQPLIGATGNYFNRRFLPLAGLKREEVSVANALRCRPGKALGLKADGIPPITTAMKLETSDADIVKALKHCRDTYLKVPDSVELIVTMGRHAMFALTGIQNEDNEYGKKQGVMESWRGYGIDVSDFTAFHTADTTVYHPLTSEKRIFFTMHIAALFQGELDSSSDGSQGQGNKKYFHATLEDFNRIKLLLSKQWPEVLPHWSDTPPAVWPAYSAFDTEYVPETSELLLWSMCDTDYNLYCIEPRSDTDRVLYPIDRPTVLAQNWIADYAHFRSLVGNSPFNMEDMFLAHTVLWTGEPHNLNYIQSKYGTLNRYKHLSKHNPKMYSACDSHQPMKMWRGAFVPQFRQDPLSWKVYRHYRVKLIEPYERAERVGSRVDTSRLEDVRTAILERLAGYTREAQELTGDSTLNLGGRKAMLEHIYG